MKLCTKLVSSGLAMLFSANCFAAGDGCDVPILYGAHNVSVSDLKRAGNDFRYDNECKGSSSSSGMNVGVEYAGVGVSLGSSSQNTSQFCASHERSAASQSAEYQYARNVVVEAYGAYIACKQLENEQVRARFKLMPRMVVIELSRLTPTAVFKGLSVQPVSAMSCEYNADKSVGIVTRNTTIALDDGKTTVITCKRSDVDAGDGERYPGADIAVDTDRGAATVTLLPSYYPPPTTTEQLLAAILSTETKAVERLSLTNRRVESLEAFAGAWHPATPNAVVTAGTSHFGQGDATCPPDTVAVGTNLTYWDPQGIPGRFTRYNIVCRPVPKWAAPPVPAPSLAQP